MMFLKVQILQRCLDSVRRWMADNFHQLKKTEVLACVPDRFFPMITETLVVTFGILLVSL